MMPAWLWLLAFFFAVACLALSGLRGDQDWMQYLLSDNIDYDFYRVAQLFTLDGADLIGENGTSWQLQAAAVLAPLVTIFAFLQLVWRDVRNGFTTLMYRYIYRNHVIVCGLGYRGTKLAKSALERGARVVAIDRDAGKKITSLPSNRRLHFVHGDAFNLEILKRCGLGRAGTVFIFAGSEQNNVSLARHVSSIIGQLATSPSRWARMICNASPSELTEQAKIEQSLGDEPGPIIEFYSPEQATARQLFQQYPPVSYPPFLAKSRINIIIFGSGIAATEIAQQAILSSQSGNTGQPPKITIVGPRVDQENRLLELIDRDHNPIAEINLHDCNVNMMRDEAVIQFEFLHEATQVVVCASSNSTNGTLGLRLRQLMEKGQLPATPIVEEVAAGTGGGQSGESAQLSDSIKRHYRSNLIFTFGANPDVLGWEYVAAAEQDKLARRNHKTYLATVADAPESGKRPAAVQWEFLGEDFRFSNRSFVDHITTKLALIDCVIAPGVGSSILTSDEHNILAEAEHARWCAEKYILGWKFGPERDDALKVHPDLVAWADLAEDKKAYAVALVGSLEELLGSAGRSVKRICRIGVSGHRFLEFAGGDNGLRSQIIKTLRGIGDRYPNHTFVVMSSLAQGADQLVADLAMKTLNAELHSVLPFVVERYRHDFSSDIATHSSSIRNNPLKKFHELLDKSKWAAELPITWNEQKLKESCPDNNTLRQRQYAHAGAYLAQACDEMVFLWDGGPVRGHGGTADVLHWRQSGSYPPEYRRQEFANSPTDAQIITVRRAAAS